jgi:hypothetical protein
MVPATLLVTLRTRSLEEAFGTLFEAPLVEDGVTTATLRLLVPFVTIEGVYGLSAGDMPPRGGQRGRDRKQHCPHFYA